MRAKWRKKRVRRLKRKRRKTRARRYVLSCLSSSSNISSSSTEGIKGLGSDKHVLTLPSSVASKHTTYTIYASNLLSTPIPSTITPYTPQPISTKTPSYEARLRESGGIVNSGDGLEYAEDGLIGGEIVGVSISFRVDNGCCTCIYDAVIKRTTCVKGFLQHTI